MSQDLAPLRTPGNAVRALLPVVILTTLTAAMPVSANPLSAYQWKQRPLLVFAGTENDYRLERLRRTVSDRRCDLAERDMIVIETLGEERAGDGLQRADATSAELRRRFDVEVNVFTVILVGKDGGEKLRSRDVPDLDAVFSLIDGMPMRRREMREQAEDCQQ